MSFDFNPTMRHGQKRSTARPSVSLPAAEPELLSPNDVALPYEQSGMFGFRKDVRTPEERAFGDACSTAKRQKQVIEQYIGWKVRFEDMGVLHQQSGERFAPQHWGIATNHLCAEREKFNRWREEATNVGVNVSDVLAQVYAPGRAMGLDVEIKRLARVFVGVESPRPMDSSYFDL